jgi:phosphoribosylformylglycinamidine (FGAM) synthase-like amidotransferase family enzyme
MKKVKVIILRTAGTNCDKETAFAFKQAGAEPELVHINQLSTDEKRLADYQILAIPGGFSYGDDIASGKILANELKYRIEDDIQNFIKDGKLIIGICNGFQILVKAGLLPNISGNFKTIEATLTLNDSAKFEDRWVYLKKLPTPNYPPGLSARPPDLRSDRIGDRAGGQLPTKCVWTTGIKDTIYLPIAHGEGKFIPKDKKILDHLKKNGMIVFEYVNNPNGSVENIAGICDITGRIFGLMPHPERHISYLQHPRWTRNSYRGTGDGFAIFKNGVQFCKKYL